MQVKLQCEAAGQCDMGGFTRLLHSGIPDDLMDEIPTFVATPLPDEGNKGYPPLLPCLPGLQHCLYAYASEASCSSAVLQTFSSWV